MKIRKILVPHDGEQMSDKALMYAAELANALGAEIILLHVTEEIEVPAAFLLGNDRAMVDRAKRTIAREMERSWNRFAQEKINLLSSSSEKAEVIAEARAGDPAAQILEFAGERDIDLIVMGSRRLEGISKAVLALGSVARKVSERASCPVMIVR